MDRIGRGEESESDAVGKGTNEERPRQRIEVLASGTLGDPVEILFHVLIVPHKLI